MVEMRSVTEPRTETHRWLTMIEGCPLSAAPRELLTETLNPLTMTDDLLFFSDIIMNSVSDSTKQQNIS